MMTFACLIRRKIGIFAALSAMTIWLPFYTHAQNVERKFETYQKFATHLEIHTSDGKIAITPFSDKIIEVQFLTDTQPAHPPSWSVVKSPEPTTMSVTKNERGFTVDTSGLSVDIVHEPFQLKYRYKNTPLVSENRGYFENGQYSGFKFNLQDSEAIYGGGERALPMNRRGYSLPLYNTVSYGYTNLREDMYFSIPLVISSNKYMILFDNAPKGVLDTGKAEEDVLSMHSIGGRKVYYIIAGDSFLDLNEQYTKLTGKQPLPPRWLLGNLSSRFGYHTQDEAEDTVEKYLQKSVPIDAIVIDLYWFGEDIKGHMGNLDWNYKAWPKPKKMMRDFRKKGIQTVLISEPFILKTSKRWQAALDADILAKDYRGEPYVFDFYFGASGLIDIFKPEAKQWLWKIYKQHTDTGVSAWWGDLGEPESHASDMVHVAGTADYVHNVYGHEWAKTLYEGYAKNYPKRRPISLMRSGFAGSQRFGMIPWSGDVARNWEGLQPQPSLTMQMGMQGLAYMHSDLGGFAAHYVDDKLFSDPMLYTRWLQYGVFQPVFRPHSQESSPAEPVFWDQRTLDLTRTAINLRYQLFPYNYTLAFENATKGHPLMRPLFYVEPDNDNLYDYSDAYLWGDNILVSPILKPKQKSQAVYFPKNGNWVDFYSGKYFPGGTTHTVDVVEEHIPTFIRTGSFVPMLPKGLKTTRHYSTDALQLLYFADEEAQSTSYTMYDDDGHTHKAIELNMHELLTFKAERHDETFNFKISSNNGKFNGRPKTRKITLIIDRLDSIPSVISVDGLKVMVATNANEIGKKLKVSALKLNDSKIAVTVEHKAADVVIRF